MLSWPPLLDHSCLTRLNSFHEKGGGAELATATDFRVLSESCFVRFVQAKLGLTPAWGGATYLSKLVGHRVALRLLASTGRVDPEAAERIGFADRVIAANPADPQDVVVLEALKFLAPIVYHDHHVSAKVPHAPAAIRAMKRALGVTDQDEEAELDRERAVFVQMWGGKEMREAIASRRKHGN